MLPILIAAGALAQTYTNDVPRALLDKLTTGVNVTRWFCYLGPGDQTEHYQDYLRDADFAAFRRLGVRFVRLCISPDAIDHDGSPDSKVLSHIDKAVDRLNSAGIAVLWDLHDNGQLKLDAPGHDNTAFVSFWQAIARHYYGKRRDSLVFELLNEPQFQQNPEVWYALQEQTVRAVRAIDPTRTIMVASTSWDGIDTFVKMQPLEERNLIYTFHCYDPFNFTHQGAEWVGEWQKNLRSVPFPSSSEAVGAILDRNDAKYRGELEDYGRHRFDDAYLYQRLDSAVQWGNRNRVPTVLGEFGAYPKVSPPESRTRWFEGMRSAIDRLRVGNALWGYDDGLGLGRRTNADGTLWLDPVTLKAFYRQASQ